MDKSKLGLTIGIGCLALIIIAGVVAIPLVFFPQLIQRGQAQATPAAVTERVAQDDGGTPVPTLTVPADPTATGPVTGAMGGTQLETAIGPLSTFYEEITPGVVSIRVYVERQGMTDRGAGSGFVLNDEGYIVTNNHVVAEAERVTVIFHNRFEARAEVVGLDAYSDLAVIQVDELPVGVSPLPLADSDAVEAGHWAIAIGNPFGLGGSMTLGIVSATGRSIPSNVAQFQIPQAIQTDAAVNPGNSGGPLLNLEGEVIGVNAQIASGGTPANAGVGLAIPSNVVRRVIPGLIDEGAFQWPWLGVSGGSVNLPIADANDLETQQGAYIDQVIDNSPADEAGLQGSTGSTQIEGLEIPTGGDVVIEANGMMVNNFDTLLSIISDQRPGDEMPLTIIRDGEEMSVTVTLEARPSNAN